MSQAGQLRQPSHSVSRHPFAAKFEQLQLGPIAGDEQLHTLIRKLGVLQRQPLQLQQSVQFRNLVVFHRKLAEIQG